jgi:hypothetical protein
VKLEKANHQGEMHVDAASDFRYTIVLLAMGCNAPAPSAVEYQWGVRATAVVQSEFVIVEVSPICVALDGDGGRECLIPPAHPAPGEETPFQTTAV